MLFKSINLSLNCLLKRDGSLIKQARIEQESQSLIQKSGTNGQTDRGTDRRTDRQTGPDIELLCN